VGLNRAVRCLVWALASSGELALCGNHWLPDCLMNNETNGWPLHRETTHQMSSRQTVRQTAIDVIHGDRAGGQMYRPFVAPRTVMFSLIVAQLVKNISKNLSFIRTSSNLCQWRLFRNTGQSLLEMYLILSCILNEDKCSLQLCVRWRNA
jgi:hypothetical protein